MATTSERLGSSEQERGLVAEALRNDAVERTLNDSLRRMMDSVRPDGIFGAAVEREGVTIIPCAEVWSSFGIGGGSGFGPANQARPAAEGGAATGAATGAQPTASGGSGGGGGGGARGRPVAVIVTSNGKTRVLPVVDVTKFMIAAMTTAGFVAFLVGQMVVARSRGRRIGGRLGGAMTAVRFARALRRPMARSV